ncbi:MAG: nicotinate-nucleotide pyrophosphorylase (carboxylating) [Lentimonas sp.]|jgi:nicotinate-nucleotide pyrophosphorylase (carboxylating)
MPKERRYSQTDFRTQLRWSDLDTDYLRQIIGLAKIEDLAGAGLVDRPTQLGDITTALLPEGASGTAQLIAREPLIACGLELVPLVLEIYGGTVNFKTDISDGDSVATGESLGTFNGSAISLLQAERIILNFLQHLAGIATETRKYIDALKSDRTTLLDTRKTLPGYRVLQKYAFACGGGYNHRIGLFDRVMLKDNHLAVTGATEGDRLSETVRLARKTCANIPVEVEVDKLDQIQPVLDAGADIILLDNFSSDELRQAIELIGDQACTEASGNIRLDSLTELGTIDLDFISTGAPIHQSTWKDIGLDWQ